MSDERYMRHCLNLACAALTAGEVPVGAVIVDGDRIVGEGSPPPRITGGILAVECEDVMREFSGRRHHIDAAVRGFGNR